VLAGVIVVPSLAMAELSAVIVRSVTMGTGQFSHFARGGLASDGISLFVSNGDDGDIQVLDLETLQLSRVIHTPLVRVWGLEYVDSLECHEVKSKVFSGNCLGLSLPSLAASRNCRGRV
jgi:hypothetical protein